MRTVLNIVWAWSLYSGLGLTQELKVNHEACQDACSTLAAHLAVESSANYVADFKHDAALHSTDNRGAQSLFWAQQQQALEPACIVDVGAPEDVAMVIQISRSTGCPFAVRGGGHSDKPGDSNIEGGILVNMAGLNDVQVDTKNKVARVGAGSKWGAVFKELDKTNHTVVGGRLTDVGVGGLTLGGGLSHLSGLHGWACDNVKNYQIVLANGSIQDVSHPTHPELYRALRGGGNNFGIVTRFDLDLYEQGPVWGGLHVWPFLPSVTSVVTEGFVQFAHEAPSDPHLSLFAGLGFMQGNFAWAVGQYDTLGRTEPPIFAQFRDDVDRYGVAKLVSTARVASMTELADELNQSEPAGKRSRFTTATVKADATLLRTMADIFVDQVNVALQKGLDADKGFAPMLGIQPLTQNFVQAQKKRGGNVLGVHEQDAPLVVCSFGWEWSSAEYDHTVLAGIKAVLDQSVAAAKDAGLYHPFKYMNYAAADQAPITSYGEDNVAFLKNVRDMYDADGVFTKLVPGGFKI